MTRTKTGATKRICYTCVKLCALLTLSHGFVQHHQTSRRQNVSHRWLVPISEYADDMTFLQKSDDYRCAIDSEGSFNPNNEGGDDKTKYTLSLVEEKDLPDLARFIVASFGADAIRLSQNMNEVERFLISPAADLLNSYSSVVAFAEVLSGTKQRASDRLDRMDIQLSPALTAQQQRASSMTSSEKIDVASRDSLVLALGRTTASSDWQVDVIASIELRLQPCDAKIPFSLPWLDSIERKLAKAIRFGKRRTELQPYLSNLCVDEKYRGKRIGRALVRCVEDIASTTWGYKKMYLHVDEDNTPAVELYTSEGYKDVVGNRWNPFWAGEAASIGYYVKKLDSKTEARRRSASDGGKSWWGK